MRTELRSEELPFWVLLDHRFAEKYDADAEEEETDDEEDSDDEEEEDSEDGEKDTKDEKKKEDDEESPEKLLLALRKERREKKALDRRVKALEAEKARATRRRQPPKKAAGAAEDEVDEEKEELKQREAAQTAKSAKLAASLLKQAQDAQIERAARKMKFRNPENALALVNRELIESDQDDDDPTDIQIDAKSVEQAVKILARKEKHLVKSEESESDGDQRSGGKFGGGRKAKGDPNKESLYATYGALARNRPR